MGSAATGPAASNLDILIVGASVGAGHNQAARAIEAALAQQRPDLAVRRVDVLDYTSRLFRAWYAGGYELAVTRFPRLYGLGFAFTDRPHRPGRTLNERRRLWQEGIALRHFGAVCQQARPRLIINTHFLAPPAVARWRQAGLLDCPQAVAITDNLPHRWWYCQGVDRWFAPQPIAVDRLGPWGIDPDRVRLAGMMVHPKWLADLPDREALAAEWKLPADRPIVLLSGGTEFVCAPVGKIARQIVAARPEAVVVVLGGRNKKLLGQIAAMPEAVDGHVVPMGFTDRLPELAELASVMVTKAGGLTTAECAAHGLPMVFLRPVPGQEADNATFYATAGAGVVTRKPAGVVRAVAEILADADLQAAMSRAAKSTHRSGTAAVLEYVNETLPEAESSRNDECTNNE